MAIFFFIDNCSAKSCQSGGPRMSKVIGSYLFVKTYQVVSSPSVPVPNKSCKDKPAQWSYEACVELKTVIPPKFIMFCRNY
eukprot:jgi/Psemu1/313151/fgenesh1_kg.1108_\